MGNNSTESKWKTITIWTLRVILALAFVAAGGAKLVGAPPMVALFAKIAWGQWFRYLTGLVELVGVALVLLPRATFLGAGLLAGVMLGAVGFEIWVLHENALPAAVLFILAATLAGLTGTNLSKEQRA